MLSRSGSKLLRPAQALLCPRSYGTADQASKSKSGTDAFDVSFLALLACPLAKTNLRYDQQQQLLISDDLGVGYPIVNGIPQLIPSCGRILREQTCAQYSGNS